MKCINFHAEEFSTHFVFFIPYLQPCFYQDSVPRVSRILGSSKTQRAPERSVSTKKVFIEIYSNFQVSVDSHPGFPWFCFTSLCDWIRKLAPLPQPISRRTKITHDLISRASCCVLVFTLSSLRLAVVIALVLGPRHSNEKC